MSASETSLIEAQTHDEIAPPEPYASSVEHLWEELRRIDLLVRAQTIRWRLTIAATKPEELWGMVHVTDAEVEAYLDTDFMSPGFMPVPMVEPLKEYWQDAH